MDWQEVLLKAVGAVLAVLLSWGTERLIAWLNTKIKNTKYAKYLAYAIEVVTRAVKTTYQTYVEALKNKNMFDADNQKEALNKAKEIILSQLNTDAQEFITTNFGDLESWITNTIESILYDLKKESADTDKFDGEEVTNENS